MREPQNGSAVKRDKYSYHVIRKNKHFVLNGIGQDTLVDFQDRQFQTPASFVREILDHYLEAKGQKFAGHPVREILRNRLPASLKQAVLMDDRFLIRGSAGLTAWTHCPWIVIMDREVTKSPKRGLYVALLFRADMTGFYVSLDHGVADTRAIYKSKTAEVLERRTERLRRILEQPPEGFSFASPALKAPPKSDGALYPQATIVSKFHSSKDQIDNAAIVADVSSALEAYSVLIEGGGEGILRV